MTLSRRGMLKGVGTAALLASAKATLPRGAWAAAEAPEVTGATLGFIALTDSAPLIIAREKGFFAKHGLPDMKLAKQASWGTTRDNIELGSAGGGIDGAHILSPMPYLISNGRITKGNVKLPMYILARLNLNGQGISVAKAYAGLGIGADAKPLKKAFADAKAAGREIKCAMTFPGGTHDLWLRYWLAANGIDPDHDISNIVVPPPQMVANMKVNTMEAFCVGEPWNAQLVNQDIGFSALTTGELWRDHPEKALAMRADWVDKNPKAAKAILMAVQEAAQFCDDPANAEAMCAIIGGRDYFKVPVDDILGRSKGDIDYGDGRKVGNFAYRMKFWRDAASYPFKSHDLWFLTEHARWGMMPREADRKALVDQVNREDVWREAAKSLGVADIPLSTSRGVETFFDGKTFDPANPDAYLASLDLKRV